MGGLPRQLALAGQGQGPGRTGKVVAASGGYSEVPRNPSRAKTGRIKIADVPKSASKKSLGASGYIEMLMNKCERHNLNVDRRPKKN